MVWRITTWWKRSHEGLRGASRFTLSHIFLRNFTGPCGLVFVFLVGCVVFLFVLVCFFWDGLVKILHSISTSSFHVSSSWPTMLRARSAMQGKKTGSIEAWLLIRTKRKHGFGALYSTTKSESLEAHCQEYLKFLTWLGVTDIVNILESHASKSRVIHLL